MTNEQFLSLQIGDTVKGPVESNRVWIVTDTTDQLPRVNNWPENTAKIVHLESEGMYTWAGNLQCHRWGISHQKTTT